MLSQQIAKKNISLLFLYLGATTTEVAPSTTSPTTVSGCVCASTGVGAIIGALLGGIVIGAVAVSVIVVLMRRHRDRSTQRPDMAIIDGDEGHYEMSTEPPRNQQIPLAGPSVNKINPPDGPTNKMTKPAVYESISENKMAAGSKAPKDATYGNVGPELSFSRDLIVIENEIGPGAFGRVLLGTAQGIMGDGNLTKVAIKTLKDGADGQAKTGLLQELDLMKKVAPHPHVVNLLGYCVEKDPIYIIVEYLNKGDLKNVLIGCRSEDTGTGYINIHGITKSLSKTLIKFARDVASGMAFLSSQKCIHRDLAARNVLVSEDMVCKVADFGLARDVMNVRIYQRESEGVLPMRWMALESLLDDVYTTESDVWSFGILLWEIVTLGARPYRLMTAKTMVAQLKEGYRMPKPRHCKEELYSMMNSCWLQNPNKRPTFRSLFKQLEKSLTIEADYIELDDLDENIYEDTKINDDNEKL
ncbi:tyrosine kinase receptor Cad96Ca-like [Asterias rubens]|uniref:tyrosine kinase receptor Cad96Ca-like n=1 Tax=Asterias rubens TaxID=7604 RepID=UPI001455AABD|nr:tyrosine kinase receptor Cad96Ca-like [Asterias rubens]